MIECTFHRGAVVSQPLTFKGARIVWDIVPPPLCRRFVYLEQNGLTGAQLAAAAKPSRQRRKGPIIRFGRKP